MKIKHFIKNRILVMKDSFIEIPELSKKLTELFNRPYYFYKNIVYCCEEQTVGTYKNIRFLVHTHDHLPLHFHVKVQNPKCEYRVIMGDDYSIKEFQKISGKTLSTRIRKTITYWYEEEKGKDDVLNALKRIGRS